MSAMDAGANILVVGAAQGIGEATAHRLAEWPGVRLVLADIQAEKVAGVAAALRDRGVDAVAYPVDIADGASVERLLDAAGEIDRLALVAGVHQTHPADEMTAEDFAHEFQVNAIGHYLTAQGLVRRLIARNQPGAIVSVTSAAARRSQADMAAYVASKSAAYGALKTLGLKAAQHGIRINFVAPTATRTAMMTAPPEEVVRRINNPAGRINQPEDIAGPISFLLSSDARGVYLREILVDNAELRGL